MEAFFTLLGAELHTFGPIYLSECFPKETANNNNNNNNLPIYIARIYIC